MHVVNSKYSLSQFIFEKYKTVQSFNLYFLQNSTHAQIYTVKALET